ncbi:MAG: hypothetical protein J6J61_07225 [Muribaculaceae bacterium]|nr:hypothetical protein [Muribaculaceae bacterium]
MRNKMYIWLPLVMLVYLGFMAFSFKDELLGAGRYFQFYGTIGIELVVIVLLFFFLRRKSRMQERRSREERELDERNRRQN